MPDREIVVASISLVDSSHARRSHKGLDAEIAVPAVKHGLGAVLWLRGDCPGCLEIYAYAEPWDGTYDGFSIVEAPDHSPEDTHRG